LLFLAALGFECTLARQALLALEIFC
jgi:hypothetical protein